MVALTYGLIQAGQDGWSDASALTLMIAGVALLAVVPVLAMLGILFTMPQYFQGVLGTTAMGSGLRLLPLVAGLMAGAVPAAGIVRLVGAKVAVTAGFVLLAVGLPAGATTSVASGGVFVAAWMAVAGLGTGIAMAPAMSAAL